MGEKAGEGGSGPGLEEISKSFAAVLALFYFVGFLVVTCHLSRYGISPISLFKLQYLVAGAWLFIPFVVPFVFLAAAWSPGPSLIPEPKLEEPPPLPEDIFDRFQQFSRKMLMPRGVLGLVREWLVMALGFVPLILAQVVVAAFGFGSMKAASDFFSKTFLQPRNLASWLGFFAGVAVSAFLALYAWDKIETEKEPKQLWTYQKLAFYMSALFVLIALWYVFWFARTWYPLIPPSLGGGKPLSVVFLLKTEQGHTELPVTPDSTGTRSIPYKLLLTTDKTFVVLSPKKEEKAIEFNRDSVLGVVVLQD